MSSRIRLPLSRRRFLSTGSTAILAGTVAMPHVARAQRADFTYKYANNLPDTHPMNGRQPATKRDSCCASTLFVSA